MQPNRFQNVAANYLGVASTLVVHVLLVPIYIRNLGAESYGIIGFFVTLQTVLQALDLGLGMALNRELARRTATSLDPKETANFLRTLEWVSWAVGATIGLAVWGLADTLASNWLAPNTLSTSAVREALGLMGLALALQWPSSLYTGGLMGLQRQALAVAVNVGGNVVFAVGVLALLALFPSVTTFLLWRAASSLLTALTQRWVLWSNLPGHNQLSSPRLEIRTLGSIWRFAMGMSGIALTGVILMQLDKIIVSRTLTLDLFGAYMVASTAAALIPQLVGPIFSTMLPPLSQAAVRADGISLRHYFHLTSQLISAIVHPVACVVAIFSEPLLLLWTGDRSVAASGGPVLSLLAVGALLNSIMVPFYAVQIACGWTRVATIANCVLLAIMVPYAVFAAQRWGAVGAASTWVVLNTVYILLSASVTLRHLLHGAAWKWLVLDVGAPLLWTVTFVATFHQLAPEIQETTQTVASIGLITVLAMLGAAVVTPEVRHKATRILALDKLV